MTEAVIRHGRKLLSAQISIAVLLTVAISSCAQTHQEAPKAFEVASVRAVPADNGYTSISPSGATHFVATNVSMSLLIQMAFGIDGNRISGAPGWIDSALYDVKAKAEGDTGLTYQQLQPLLQQLLEQRFHLLVHHEAKDVSGYALLVAKGGSKVQPGKEVRASGYIFRNGVQGPSLSMKSLAGMLAIPLGRPVIDKTGLTGNYAINLAFAPVKLAGSADADGTADSSLPSIFTALQEQLGLRVESQKVPIDLVVIDHIEKVPTEN